MDEQRCLYCDGHLEPKLVTRLQRYQEHWVVIENVPALVCPQCGEQYFTPAAHDLVVNILKEHPDPVRTETVNVYDANQVA
jgi:YgiT-type zinc finger domain-containing protein